MNGAQRRLAVALGIGLFALLMVIMAANATSMISDFAEANVPISRGHVWLFEASSIAAWITLLPAVWWLVAWLRRRRLAWWWNAAIVLLATVPGAAWHIVLMWAIRAAVYAAEGEHYSFVGGMADPWLYEYRKDVATILQFGGFALLAQWLLARAATVPDARPTLAVNDGAVTYRVPLDEIDWIASAANYVEIAWGQRRLLNRKTLASMEEELGEAFVRIHRTRLVRRAAIRRTETDRSGDFTVTLASGEVLRGSRRYRGGIKYPFPRMGSGTAPG